MVWHYFTTVALMKIDKYYKVSNLTLIWCKMSFYLILFQCEIGNMTSLDVNSIFRERFRSKILHSKTAMQKRKNLHSKIIFYIAICEFCIANLKCLKLQYAVCTGIYTCVVFQSFTVVWFICIQCPHFNKQNSSLQYFVKIAVIHES